MPHQGSIAQYTAIFIACNSFFLLFILFLLCDWCDCIGLLAMLSSSWIFLLHTQILKKLLFYTLALALRLYFICVVVWWCCIYFIYLLYIYILLHVHALRCVTCILLFLLLLYFFFIKKLIHTYAEPFCRRRRSDTKGIYYFSLNHYFPVLYIWISIYLYLIR